MFYSKETNAFYLRQSFNAPDDLAEITDELYKEVFEKQAQGMQIVAGDDGMPTTIDRVDARSDDEKRAADIATLKAEAKAEYLRQIQKQGYDDMTELLLLSGEGDTQAGATSSALARSISIVKTEMKKTTLPKADDLMAQVAAEFDGL